MQSKYTPGPWKACHDGKCSCGQIWSIPADHPVAKVEIGAWGDTWPAIRLTDGPGMHGTTAQAYIERMDYGSVDEETAHANARLIASAPTLAALLASTIEWCPVCKGTGFRTYVHRKQSEQQPCIVKSCIEARAVLRGLGL